MVDNRRQPHQSAFSWNKDEMRQPGNGAYKRGLNTKLHLAVDAHGKPVRAQPTAGTAADCSQAIPLLKNLDVQCLLADRGYDTNAILEYAQAHGITAGIPSVIVKTKGNTTKRCANSAN